MKCVMTAILAAGLAFLAPLAQADWSPSQRLTWNSGQSWDPAISVDSSGNPHVVWQDDTSGNCEIYYKKSTDGGATWPARKRLTWTSGGSYNPAIAAYSSGSVYVVWYDDTSGNDEIYFKMSSNGGADWSANKRLTWNSGTSFSPALAADWSDNPHVVWNDSTAGNSEIFYKRSTDGGTTWSAAKRLTWTSGFSYGPAIAAGSSGNLDVAWYDDTPANREIYHKRSTDGGTTWTAAKRLTWNSGESAVQSLALDPSGNLQLIWQDDSPGNREIFFKKSTDGGATWTANYRLTWTLGDSMAPILAIDSGGILHVVWGDKTPGHEEIYYKMSPDEGATWTADRRLTWTPTSRRSECAAGPSNDVHVVYEEAVSTQWEIFYKKKN